MAVSPIRLPLVAAAFAFFVTVPLPASLLAAPAVAAPQVTDAWVRLPAVAGRPAGGYFTAHGGSAADTLLSVTSPGAERIETHTMVQDGATMKMRAEPRVALPAGGTLQFAPGGRHLMLFGLEAGLKPGDRLPLTFRFESGATVTVEAEARAAGAPAGNAPAPASQHQH